MCHATITTTPRPCSLAGFVRLLLLLLLLWLLMLPWHAPRKRHRITIIPVVATTSSVFPMAAALLAPCIRREIRYIPICTSQRGEMCASTCTNSKQGMPCTMTTSEEHMYLPRRPSTNFPESSVSISNSALRIDRIEMRLESTIKFLRTRKLVDDSFT